MGYHDSLIRPRPQRSRLLLPYSRLPRFPQTPPGIVALELIPQHRYQWGRALSATIELAATQASISPSDVGLIGFSLGGHLAHRLRSHVRVLVSFFAPLLDGLGPKGNLRSAQLHHGTSDQTPGTGFENAGIIQQVLLAEGASVDFNAYPGAGHGFNSDDEANRIAQEL
jgi:dienelactone hydrolase